MAMHQSSDPNPPSRRLTVALLSPGWPAASMANGIVSYTETLVRALNPLGVRCHVIAAQLAGDADESSVHLIRPDQTSLKSKVMWRLTPRTWGRRSFCKALLDEVRRLHEVQGVQLLELEESFGWAAELSGNSPVPIVVRLHGPWFLNGVANGAPRDRAYQTRDDWERAGLEAADAVTAPSHDVLDQTRSHFGLELADAIVIPNPVEPLAPANRWKLNAADPRRIAFIGRFDRHKGGDTAIDAFTRLLVRNADLRLDFVGPDRGYIDQASRTWSFDEYLRAQLGGAGREKVTFHGFQPGSAASELRKRALVTLAPSRYETFGISAAEAMMAGCPLVVCRAGALTELVQDGQNGLVAQPGDADDLAEKVLSLINDPNRAAALGAQAAIDAADRYTPAVVARRTLDFYQTVLAGAVTPRAGVSA